MTSLTAQGIAEAAKGSQNQRTEELQREMRSLRPSPSFEEAGVQQIRQQKSQCHYVVKAEFDGRQYGDDYLVLKKGDTVMVSWLSLCFASRH